MKRFILATTAAVLTAAPSMAQVTYAFAPFAALSEGKDCTVTFSPQTLDVCGKAIPLSDVRGWTWRLGPGMTGERPIIFAIYGQDLSATTVEFRNQLTADRFTVQFGVWSGKEPSSPGGGHLFK